MSNSTTEDKYLLQLDGLRCVAVLLVLVDHWLAERNKLPLGPLGVTLFFVLSGFLISGILIRSKLKDQAQQRSHWFSFKQFYIRRSLRIFPIYYLSVLVLIAANSPSVQGKIGWHLLYGTNLYIALHKTWLGITDHFWSLAVEEQFYLFFPLFIFILPTQYLVKAFGGLILLSVSLRLFLYLNHADWKIQYVSMPTCLDAFGLGAILAFLFQFRTEYALKLFERSRYLLMAVFVYVGVLVYSQHQAETRNIGTEVWERLAAAVMCFFLIGGGVRGYKGLAKRILQHPITIYLGKISYGLYIYHNFVFNFYHTPPSHITLRLLRKIHQVVPVIADHVAFQLGFFFCLTLVLATVSWYLIEKPINNLKKYFTY